MRIFAVLAFLLHAWAGSAFAQQPEVPPIGANKVDLFAQYLGVASGCRQTDPCRRVTRAMGQKAIEDAEAAGIRFLRVSMTGPISSEDRNVLAMWRDQPAEFWRRVDEMMDDLDSRQVRLVPVLMWGSTRFPIMAGETAAEMIKNPSSKSWALLSRFVTEFITRYRARPTVLFYELTNELNSVADLDQERRCAANAKRLCESVGSFSTDDLIAFTGRFARLIRGLDDKRKISSGFTIPRPQAEHLRARAQWSAGGPDWTFDTREQFNKNIADLHREVDIVSIHLYGGERNKRFGSDDVLDLLAQAKRAADAAGKPLFVGEFGDRGRGAGGADNHTSRMARKVAELKISYAGVWVWQYYQRNTFTTHDTTPSEHSLEPGHTDFLIQEIKRANAAAAPAAMPRATPRPPRVVLTWPLECAAVRPVDLAHAVASDEGGPVERVEFWLDDKLVATDTTVPFQAKLALDGVPPGEHVLAARAFDRAGNRAEFTSRVGVGAPVRAGSCR